MLTLGGEKMKKLLFLTVVLGVVVFMVASCSFMINFTKEIPLNVSKSIEGLNAGSTDFDSMTLTISTDDLPLNHVVTTATITVVVDFTAGGGLNPPKYGNGVEGTIKFCISEESIDDITTCNDNAISGDLSYHAGENNFEVSSEKIANLLNQGYRTLYFGFIVDPDSDGDINVEADELKVVGKKPAF